MPCPPSLRTTRAVADPSHPTTGADPEGCGFGYASAKKAFDLALAATLLFLTGPVVLAVMALVKITSPGPALYTQARLGRLGRRFTIYKIRTMWSDCERLTGPLWSPVGDPRVTPLGRVLRRCHLDELPQLWNVLRGEMSLVGPRPERPEIIRKLELAIPEYRERLRVSPGITGLAQIQLPPDEDVTGVRHKVAYDLLYIDEMGPWLDAKILLGTALKVAGVATRWRRRLLRLPTTGRLMDAPREQGVKGEGFPELRAV